jgi:hypothetical protein
MVAPRLQFVRYHVGWMLATILALVTLGEFSLTQFYVISVIGYFLIAELTVAEGLRLPWRRRVRVVGILLGLGFVLVVGRQIQQILATGV